MSEKQNLAPDLNRPEYFFNRELSWLKFNLRVLREAEVKTTPLLERLKLSRFPRRTWMNSSWSAWPVCGISWKVVSSASIRRA